jgi:type II secretory pathway pseudopilin PulG
MQPKEQTCSKFALSRCRAFTRADLLVTMAAVALLAALVVTPLVTMRRNSRLSLCLSNLQQIDRAVLLYSENNRKVLPDLVGSESGDFWWWYKERVKGYAGLTGPSSTNDRVFACPDDRGYSDPRPFHRNARFDYGSYVYNGVLLPRVPNIAGWQLSSVKLPQKTLLVMEWTAHAPLSWHRSKTGKENSPFYCDAQSVVAFVDGHASFTKIYYDGYNAAYTRDPIAGYDYKYSGN